MRTARAFGFNFSFSNDRFYFPNTRMIIIFRYDVNYFVRWAILLRKKKDRD